MRYVKHLRHHTHGDKYHCRSNKKRSKLSRRNNTQNCGKYDGRYTHEKYKVNDKNNYNYSNSVSYTHLDVYKRQMQVYAGEFTTPR